jgi:serine O-acetyltransferase
MYLKKCAGGIMITTKKELEHYLERDAIALRTHRRKKPKLFGDEIWKFQITLRKAEYYQNLYKNSKKQYFFHYAWYKFMLHKRSIMLGFSIPVNVAGPGFSIAHYGTIVINPAAKIGKNCRIHTDVNIGATGGSKAAPQIGDNVYIGNNVILLPGVAIGDNVIIGAGAVVTHDIPSNSVAAGVPARVVESIDVYFEKIQRESIHLGHLKGKEKDRALMEYYGYTGGSQGIYW